MMKSHGVKFIGLSLVLGCSLALNGCSEENPNYKAAGTGTFDQSTNPRAPGNTELLLKNLTNLSQNETEKKALTACKRLGAMGAVAEGSLSVLEKVAQESGHESVRAEAAKSVELIKAAVAGGTTEQ